MNGKYRTTAVNDCAWCYEDRGQLIKHHYPIAKAQGGSETIYICARCHSIVHAQNLFDCRLAVSEEEFRRYRDYRMLTKIIRFFPKLYEHGCFSDPFDRCIILNPIWKVKGLTVSEREQERAELGKLRSVLINEGLVPEVERALVWDGGLHEAWEVT